MSIRVLVVDDSVFMRRAIRDMIDGEPGLEVVAVARHGAEGVKLAKQHQPDVVTLDIEMPEMDGLTALRRIKRETAAQVLMCSSLTTEGSQASLQALRMGAADVIAKDHSTFSAHVHEMREDLVSRVKALGESAARKRTVKHGGGEQSSSRPFQAPTVDLARLGMLCIGASTGGPPVLETILPRIQPQIGVPVVVAQHMPKLFTESLAKRLSDICACQVRLLDRGLPLKPGVIHLAPGGLHTHIKRRGSGMPVAHLDEEPKADLYRPSVDVLFETAADAVDRPVLGVVLTGIGHDGLRGAQRVCERQGKVWSQCEASSVVYGMPKAVAEAGLCSAVLSPEQLGDALENLTAKKAA